MNFQDTPEEADFRARLRAWLEANAPGEQPADDDARIRQRNDWHRMLFAAGWLGLSWPIEYGGQGLSPVYELILNDEIGATFAPALPPIGFLGRAFLNYGSEEQKRRYLRRLLAGEDTWCQGFSEPGAGSDLAAVTTRATRQGDDYVISGQKIWTSEAAWAQYCFLLARTGDLASRHRGLSCFVVPLASPGVTVSAIRMINGDRDFGQVFFDDVVVPQASRVGDEGVGWSLAMSLFGYERGPADIGVIARLERSLRELEERVRDADAVSRAKVARARVAQHVLRVHVLRSLSQRLDGSAPGPESSIDKVLLTRVWQQIHRTAVDVLGPTAVTGADARWYDDYLYSRGMSIAGGTAQIQDGIIAERLLGLPRA